METRVPGRVAAVVAVATLLAVLAAAGVSNSGGGAGGADAGTMVDGAPVPSSEPAIFVDGNDQLAAVASRGSGTAGDPYVIENRNVDAGGTGSAIHIRNTTAHFVIRNCTATGWEWDHAGIWLENVTNANVSGNNASGNGRHGIWFYFVSNSKASGNNISGNGDGIYLSGSSNNMMSGNNISGNGDGIYLSGSSNNTVSGNTVSNNTGYGIVLYESSNDNTVSSNEVSGNGDYGIFLSGSNNNVSGNTVSNNDGHGIYLSGSSNNNQVSGNTVSGNDGHSIYLSGSSNTEVSGNTVQYNLFRGCIVDSGSGNILTDNDCSIDWAVTLADPMMIPTTLGIVAAIVIPLLIVFLTLRTRAVKKRKRVEKEERVARKKQQLVAQLLAQHDALVEAALNAEQSGDVLKAMQQYSDAHRLLSNSALTSEFQPIVESDHKEMKRLKEIIRVDLESQIASASRLIEQGNYEEALRQLQPAIEKARNAGLDHSLRSPVLATVKYRIKSARKTASVKEVVADMSNKFQRVSVGEIKERYEKKETSPAVDEEFIVKVLKDMLGAGEVQGEYFESSKSVLFEFVHDDLDKEFASWHDAEKTKDGKI